MELLSTFRRHISTIAFVGGFLLDAFTIDRVDGSYSNLVFVFYLLIAGAGIILVHGAQTKRFTWAPLIRLQEWLTILVQFPIGGLFSGMLIFYFKSASVWVSWPFLVTLACLLVGNEFFTKRYERLVFQIAIFYITLFMYIVLITPVLLNTMGAGTFVLAGMVSLLVIVLFLRVIMRLFPLVYKTSIAPLWGVVGGIFITMHMLYFTNLIPPVPLALKSAGIYHSVVRDGNVYRLLGEEAPWYAFWRLTNYTVHKDSNEALYCFSAVFAPTLLRTTIQHVWQHKDTNGMWVAESTASFPVLGGREGGYRGYTIKRNPEEGKWRCLVETERGQVIGRLDFEVVGVSAPVRKVEMIL